MERSSAGKRNGLLCSQHGAHDVPDFDFTENSTPLYVRDHRKDLTKALELLARNSFVESNKDGLRLALGAPLS